MPEELGVTCIDGGKCHHSCEQLCYRRRFCSPLGGYEGPWNYDMIYQYQIIDPHSDLGKDKERWYNASFATYEFMKGHPERYRTRRLIVLPD